MAEQLDNGSWKGADGRTYGSETEAEKQNFIIMGIPIIIAAIYYLIASIPFAKQAAALKKQNMPLPEFMGEDETEKVQRNKKNKKNNNSN